MKSYPFKNATGGTIPAGAALVPSGGLDANGLMLVTQPAADSSLFVVFNGPGDVPDGATGVAFDWTAGDVPVGVNPADAPYTAADTFGTAAGDWLLRKGKKGFRVVTPTIQGIANAMPDPLGGAESTPSLTEFSYVQSSLTIAPATPPGTSPAGTVLPAGYTVYDTLDGTTLPVVSDTVRLRAGTAWNQIPLVYRCHYQLWVDHAAGVPAGWFVLQFALKDWPHGTFDNWVDLETIPYPAGGAPVFRTAAVGLPATVYRFNPLAAEVTVAYRLIFISNGAAPTARPEIRLAVCTAALSFYRNPPVLNWGDAGNRGGPGIAACPTLSVTEESSAE